MSVSSRGRLQRSPDFTGGKLQTFKAVFFRHGLPCACLALVFLVDENLRALLTIVAKDLVFRPNFYVLAGLVILTALVAHSIYKQGEWQSRHISWILYLGMLSIWEEWVFRVGVPFYLQSIGVSLLASIFVSNLAFGVMHYFTLRWKWYWCVIAGLGGLAFSRHIEMYGNFAVIVGIHWVATYFNTPNLPGTRALR